MVEIYIRDLDKIPDDREYVADVEKEFNFISLSDSDTVQKLMREIEEAKWIDADSFEDRFGYKLWMDNMSTGCKAGLIAACEPEKVINLIECGYNARDSIILSLSNGHLLIDFDDTPISVLTPKYNKSGIMIDTKIRIKNSDYIFTSLDRLNEYLMYEKLTEPDMSKPGIERA